VRDIGEVMHDPHLRARGFAYDADHPVAGIRPAAGVPWLYDGVRTRIGPAPLLGSATQELTGLEPPAPPARR
jgi:crotonobetainyl-CoA:carnitine CoA-transferase CaiB-like acyl-CoA transferase